MTVRNLRRLVENNILNGHICQLLSRHCQCHIQASLVYPKDGGSDTIQASPPLPLQYVKKRGETLPPGRLGEDSYVCSKTRIQTWELDKGAGKLWSVGPGLPTACFCEWSFTGTQPTCHLSCCPCLLSGFIGGVESLRHAVWPTKYKIIYYLALCRKSLPTPRESNICCFLNSRFLWSPTYCQYGATNFQKWLKPLM